MIQQLALTDAVGKPFAQIAREWVLDADRHDQQHVRAAAACRTAGPGRPRAQRHAARAWRDPWHVYPEQAAAGLWTTPTDLARFADRSPARDGRSLAQGAVAAVDRAR